MVNVIGFGENKGLSPIKDTGFYKNIWARYYALAAQRFLIMKKVKCNRQLKL